MKPTPYVLAAGKLQPEDITIKLEEPNLILTESIEKRIEEIWEEKLIESQHRGKEIFNGSSYRLNSWSYSDGRLNLALATYDYKHRLGLLTMIKNKELDEYQWVHGGCYVAATVLTSDQKYVLVRLSGKSMNDNHLEMLGGMAETDIPCTDGNYLFDVLYQELLEEGGITKDDISSCYLRALYASTSAHFGFYFEVKLTIDQAELENRFHNNTDVDIASLLFVDRTEYLNTLKNISANKQLIARLVTS